MNYTRIGVLPIAVGPERAKWGFLEGGGVFFRFSFILKLFEIA
tara:strand:+ start:2662 stop:2790 length:129 start_codon:yes stop_codon:yes gene_type:complete